MRRGPAAPRWQIGSFAITLALLALSACKAPVPQGPARDQASMVLTPLASLPGWSADHPARAMPALLEGCSRLLALPADQSLGGQGDAARLGGTAGEWRPACLAARNLSQTSDAQLRAFLDFNFQAFEIRGPAPSDMLFTGYFEPEVPGARTHGGVYQTPLLRRPADLVPLDLGDFAPELMGRRSAGRLHDGALVPYYDRAEITRGALDDRHLELAWLADPIDAFFLQIQGSGRIRLPDGQVMRVAFAGQNGRAYVPIGKLLADRGQVPADQISMQTIRAWLVSHPDQAPGLMNQNPSYVFFRELAGARPEQGPPGALGAALTPGRSVAIDRSFIPLGAPLWIDTTDPLDGQALQRLVLAQDLGGAITGPLRTDIFFGWGPDAAAHAGRMRQGGREFLLLPRPASGL